MHNRAGGHRGLTTAVRALIGEGLGLQQPSSALATTGADKSVRPTTLEKVFRACAFRRIAALELDQRPRKPAFKSRHSLHSAHAIPMSSLRPRSCFVHNI